MKKRITFVIGTRPELIKVSKVVNYLKSQNRFKVSLISSQQQVKLLKQNMSNEDEIDLFLNIKSKKSDQDFISKLLICLDIEFKKKPSEYIFVQGDTSTAFASCLYGFLNKIPVIHLESGLRTFDNQSPWPEEFYRQSIAKMADIHLSPTEISKLNLINEGIKKEKIFIVGNPGIDNFVDNLIKIRSKKLENDKTILITMHRRESLYGNLQKFCINLKKFIKKNKEIRFLWPIHTNPKVVNIVKDNFTDLKHKNIKFLKPLRYLDFIDLLQQSSFVITDSGGVQEEAAYLGKPILIARDKTERVEIINLNLGKIIFADGRKLEQAFNYFIRNPLKKNKINRWKKIQGLGKSSLKINKILDTILLN